MKIFLVLFSFFSVAPAFADGLGLPTTREKITCLTIETAKHSATDALPETTFTEMKVLRSFWSADDVTHATSKGEITVKKAGASEILYTATYESQRETLYEKLEDGLEIERSVIKVVTRQEGLEDRSQQYTWAEHFRTDEDGRRVVIRQFRDGVEVPNHVEKHLVFKLSDGRKIETSVIRPHTSHNQYGSSFEISRSETTCLTEGVN